MKIPPSVVRLKIKSKKNLSLWVPIFLLWPLIFLLGIIVFPLILLVLLIYQKGRMKKSMMLFPALYNVVADLKGLNINIENKENSISIVVD